MQIVIDIPEEDYEGLKKKDEFNDMYLNHYEKLIVHGTPLPKGHGRLIDADAFHKVVEEIPIKDTDKWFNWMQKTCNRLADAPTIIEADKAESEDKE